MKLLLVGVGGIGCEFVDLLLRLPHPVTSLCLVDPDTVEASNLPRQRLFSVTDIGQYKALVAASKLLSHSLPVNSLSVNSLPVNSLTAHSLPVNSLPVQAYALSIQNDLFNSTFFSQFDAAVLAVDSSSTRRWLSGALMQNDVPLIIDLGSTGFQASCRVWRARAMRAGSVGCLECTSWMVAGDDEEAFDDDVPVCSVHGKPTSLMHCMVWALRNFERNGIARSEQVKSANSSNEFAIPEEIKSETIKRANQFSIPHSDHEILSLFHGLTSRAIPAVASVNALIAGKGLQELIASGTRNYFYYNLEEGIYWMEQSISVDPTCPFCSD